MERVKKGGGCVPLVKTVLICDAGTQRRQVPLLPLTLLDDGNVINDEIPAFEVHKEINFHTPTDTTPPAIMSFHSRFERGVPCMFPDATKLS